MKGATRYQVELLETVQRAQDAGADIDFDELIETLSWKPTKESAQFSIRALVKKGQIAKTDLQLRRGRRRVCFQITPAGRLVLDPRPPAAPPTPAVPAAPAEEAAAYLPGPALEAEDLVPGLSETEIFE